MSITPLAAIGLYRIAKTVAQDILAIPQSLRKQFINPYVSKSYNTNSRTDSLQTSSASKQGQAIVSGLTSQVELQEAEALNKEKLAALSHRIHTLFAEHGINTNQPVTLRYDGKDRVQVAGHHPEKSRIEALLDREGIAPEFARLAISMSSTQYARTNTATGLPTQYSLSNGDRLPVFNLVMVDGQSQVRFTAA